MNARQRFVTLHRHIETCDQCGNALIAWASANIEPDLCSTGVGLFRTWDTIRALENARVTELNVGGDARFPKPWTPLTPRTGEQIRIPLLRGTDSRAVFEDGGECVMETHPVPYTALRILDLECRIHGQAELTHERLPDVLRAGETVKVAVKATGRTVVQLALVVVDVGERSPPKED